ncbi:MAG: ferrous iron transport protein A [Fimbriimonadaceae bacterium]
MCADPAEVKMCCAPLKVGDRAVVTSVDAKSPHGLRLAEMGLVAGTEFRVAKVAPLGDPIEIELRNYRLCLRRLEAEDIEIRMLESAA